MIVSLSAAAPAGGGEILPRINSRFSGSFQLKANRQYLLSLRHIAQAAAPLCRRFAAAAGRACKLPAIAAK